MELSDEQYRISAYLLGWEGFSLILNNELMTLIRSYFHLDFILFTEVIYRCFYEDDAKMRIMSHDEVRSHRSTVRGLNIPGWGLPKTDTITARCIS